jgi:hypothetical protein
MKTLLHLIYVLWTGEGMWGWVRPWLPWLFRIPVTFWVLRLIYRIYWAPPNLRGYYVRGSRLVEHRWVRLRQRWGLNGSCASVAWRSRSSSNPCTCS